MKKLTLFLVATLFSALSFALNPYAYGLSSELSADKTNLTVNYSLNADATGVSVVILDGATEIKTITCNDKKTKGTHSVSIPTSDFPPGKSLTWKVVVEGTSVEAPTQEEKMYNMYCPHGLAIDKDPESEYFGRILVADAMDVVKDKAGYLGSGIGAGLHAFNPSFTTDSTVYKGGNDFTRILASNGYQPWRVKISEDGRIFVSSLDLNGVVVWEVSKDLQTWTPVIAGTNNATDHNIYDADGNFVAGLNCSMDVIGSGEDLKLLLYSTNNKGIAFNQSGYRLDEYALGTATTWTGTPKNIINGGAYGLVHTNVEFIYDGEGGYWFGGSRAGNAGQPNLVHINAAGEQDYYTEDAGLYGGDGVLVHNGMLFKGKARTSSTVGNFGVWTIGKDADGKVTLTEKWTVAANGIGRNLNEFAVDFAENLYIVGNSGEKIIAYALPYSGTVSTPCASKYAFSLPAPPQLNPFAYKLSSELSADEKDLTVNYSLNAPATSVEWVLMDGTTEVKRVDLSSFSLAKGDYTTTISTADFPTFKQLTWKIEVKGVAVSEPTEYPVNYSFYHPSSVDIDNNPENATFGLILTNEGMQKVKNVDGYQSTGYGAGIYAFTPSFDPMPNGDKPGYNGGIEFTTGRADGSGTAYAPRRIRISDDGRIFVTSLNTDGNYLWEVNSENMNEWTPIFKGTLNDNKELVDNAGNFVAAPNNGFDVKGSGENLKLAMYSVNLPGIKSAAMSGFRLHEYNLGTATTWTTAPSKALVEGKYAINYTGTQVVYDNEGGFWIASYRAGNASNTNPGLVHINANGQEDAKLLWNYLQQAGIRFNNDFTKLVVAGLYGGSTGTTKKATVYTIAKNANGTPVLTEETVIDMKTVGSNLNDFAWDYAGNLYACGNSSEKLAVWAMPHSSEDAVATPAASKYAFSIGKYTVTALTNDENKGTVTGGGEYGAGAVVTLTATPKEGYELLYWSDRSKENPRNITVDGNEALSAYFIKKNDVEPTFSITKVWENTNVPASTGNGFQAVGWDGKIYMQDASNTKIVTYSSAEDTGTDYATSGSGQQIAVDEAGNLIVFNAWFATSKPGAILIYQKGSTEGKAVSFTLIEPQRCDFISASGDIFSADGGYVYFYCQTKTVVNRVKITNGAATAADITIDAVGSEIADGNSQNHVIVDIFGNLMAHSRTNSNTYAINVHTDESKLFVLPNHKYTTLGGCSFELGGKELWAYNVGTTNFSSEWNLYNITDGKFLSNDVLYTIDKANSDNKAANWLNVQVVDEKNAYIYQYCPKKAVAVWKVTRDHIVSATAENGTVEGAGTYKDNATATLTATANDGYVFKNWTKNGAVVSTENPYSFTVTEDVELVANFDGPFCELILNTNDEAKGTVEGAGFYNVGQTVTIKATPEAGYKLLYWSDRSTQNPRTITMNKKEALSAYFVKVYDEEPTFAIEKVWENTNVPTSSNNGFQAVGWDEKIYMKDRLGAAINVYTATGSELYVNTDAFTSEDALRGDQPIAIDDAGNIIIRSGSGLFYSAPKQVTIYKNGDKTGKVIDFTLPATGRCDFISASGDIYSTEGGYVYFYCQNQTTVSRLYIKNGGASAADISVDKLDNATLTAGSSQSHVFTNIFGDLMTHTRDNNYKVLQEVNVLTGAVSTMNLPNFKKSTLGGCSFELGGKEFIAYNIAGTDYNSEWNLYNMTDKEFVSAETLYAKDRTSKKTSGAANWLNVQVVDEETAYIYQFCPEVAVAVWKVSLINTVVIDERAVNTDVLDEYEGQTVTAKVTRAFNNDSYKTLTLPFDMTEAQIKAVFGETAIVHEFTSVGEENDMFYLHFDPTTTIEAGKPYILQLPTTGEYDAKDGFTIENVTINTTLNPVVQGAITMQPILDGGGRLDQASDYWLAADNFIYSAGAHPTALLGLRAYFINSTGRPIRARVVYGENEATSIPTVVAPEESVRKVMKDGQIIIIRGEKQYNIQGQVIE